MLELVRYKQYSRKDLHELTIQDREFRRGSGKWGLQGIVRIPNTRNDFVFFVTFGQEEGGHVFQEGIDKNGLLNWQSQPKQKLHHPQIKRFIDHDPTNSNIYLLLRTHDRSDYTYLGLLSYVSHDWNREQPVWFQWRIIDWELKEDVFEKIGLKIGKAINIFDSVNDENHKIQKNELKEVQRNPFKRKKSFKSASAARERKIDYLAQSKTNKSIGDAGEFLVLEWERLKLSKLGIDKMPIHVAAENDNAGYDILSYDNTGNEIFIEVKTTRGSINSSFYVTSNELETSLKLNVQYYLYRLYDYNIEDNNALFYKVKGPLNSLFELKPKDYIAHFIGSDEEN